MKNKGYTLLEIMIVIAIIGIISLFLLPSMTAARHRALLSSCISNEKNLASALESYAVDDPNSFYPSDDGGKINKKALANYINRIPQCPASKQDYGYQVNAKRTAYTIICEGNAHTEAKVSPNFPQYSNTAGTILK